MDLIKQMKCALLLSGMTLNVHLAGALPAQMPVPVMGESGTISFRVQTDQAYRNGAGQENYRQSLIRLPGIFDISFSQTDPSVNVAWIWDGRQGFEGKFHDIIVDMTDLPGPETYFLQYTWDSGLGLPLFERNGAARSRSNVLCLVDRQRGREH